MAQKLATLDEHKTWKLESRPRHHIVACCKWIFKVKEKQRLDGSFGTGFKARLVAKGFPQVEGVDYSETFASVFKLTSIRIILSLVVSFDLHLQ